MWTFIAALAGSLTATEITPDQSRFPTEALRKGRSAAALVEFLVNPQGEQQSCKSLAEFGDEKLSSEICNLQGRATFKPAINEAGQPAYGVVRAFIKYVRIGSEGAKDIYAIFAPDITHEVVGTTVRSGTRPPDLDEFRQEVGPPQVIVLPDVELEVPSLSETYGNMLLVRVTVSLDTSGAVTHCAGDAFADPDNELSQYANAACDHLLGVSVAEPLVIDGGPVPHVRSLQVQFNVASQS